MGLPLYWLALLLFAVFGVLNFFYLWARDGKYPKGYFWHTAFNIDCFANREFRALWNGSLITIQGYRFGDINQTLSEVLGHNYALQTLTRYGKVVVFLLSPNHCLKAAGLAQIKEPKHTRFVRVIAWIFSPLLLIWATPQPLRIAIFGLLAGLFGWLCNHRELIAYLYIGMAFVFLFVIDVLWLMFKTFTR